MNILYIKIIKLKTKNKKKKKKKKKILIKYN